MGNFQKMYFGAISSEEEAARLYDKLSVVFQGLEAKTNFDYTKQDVLDILNDRELFDKIGKYS